MRSIAHGCVIVLEIRQYSFVLFLAMHDPASPPFVRLFIWIAIDYEYITLYAYYNYTLTHKDDQL